MLFVFLGFSIESALGGREAGERGSRGAGGRVVGGASFRLAAERLAEVGGQVAGGIE